VQPTQATSLKTTGYCLFILLLCCLFSFWPLTFHVFSLKNDALNYFLPVRHQISELIYNGYWPLWSPYFNLGYPLHGDMQSGAWNPFVQIISLFGPYSLRTLQYETLFYVYISGVGMFFLIQYFFKDWRISLLTGGSFMLCGFNSDSAQFLNWISAASFLPFIFLFYCRTLTERNWRTALSCAIFLYLSFVTSYPADFILTCYFLFFFFVWFLLKKNERTKQALRSHLILHSVMLGAFLLLSLPAIISYAEFLPLSERGSGANYADVMSNPLHPGLLLSYLTPLPVWKAPFAGITDPLERNSFFGLIPLTLFILSFFVKLNHPITRFLKWAFFVSLLFSFGKVGGVRIFAYYILPLMNVFRHPANERLFSIFIACLLAAFSLRELLNGNIPGKIKKMAWLSLSVLLAGLIVWAIGNSSLTFHGLHSINQVKPLLDEMGFPDFLLINIVIQIPFLIAVYFWLVKKVNWRLLLTIALINSCIHTFLYQPLTVVKKDRAITIQNILDEVQVRDYPMPDLKASLHKNSKNGMDLFKEIGVINMYNKKIGRVDYRITPSNLLSQNEFWFNPKLRNILLDYPIFYKADTIINITDTSKLIPSTKKLLIAQTSTDTVLFNTSDYVVKLNKFTPLSWEIEVQCDQPGFYSLLQNYYPRWQLLIDGKKKNIERCNVSFIGFKLPAGKHIVSLQYQTFDLALTFFISLAALIIILVLVAWKPAALQRV
jgi:hypothetical protein